MKKVLIGIMLGLFLFGVGIANTPSVWANEQHARQYEEWREKTMNYLSLGTKCLKVNNNVRKIAHIIELQYNSPDNIVLLGNCIKSLHKDFIILHGDKGDSGISNVKFSDVSISSVSSSDETRKWFLLELSKAMEPIDNLACVADKTKIEAEKIASTKLESVKFLHVIVENLRNGDDFRKALQDVDAFEKKLRDQKKRE